MGHRLLECRRSVNFNCFRQSVSSTRRLFSPSLLTRCVCMRAVCVIVCGMNSDWCSELLVFPLIRQMRLRPFTAVTATAGMEPAALCRFRFRWDRREYRSSRILPRCLNYCNQCFRREGSIRLRLRRHRDQYPSDFRAIPCLPNLPTCRFLLSRPSSRMISSACSFLSRRQGSE